MYRDKWVRVSSLNFLKQQDKTAIIYITNFIQLVSLQPVNQFSQTKLHWKVPNESYPHI